MVTIVVIEKLTQELVVVAIVVIGKLTQELVVVVAIVVIGRLTQVLSKLYDHASLTVVALMLTRHCRKASRPQFGLPWPGSPLGKAERSKGTS